MVIRNSFYYLTGQILIKIINFAYLIFTLRYLGNVEYGKYALTISFVGMLMVMCDLGMGSYISREIARDKNQVEQYLGNMIAVRFILSVLFIIVATGAAWLFGYAPEIVFAIFVTAACQLLFAVQSSLDAVLIGSQQLGASALASVVSQLLIAFSGTLILLAGLGFLSLIIANVIGVLAATLLNSTTIKRRIGQTRLIFTPKSWLRLLKGSIPFGINQFALSITYRLDSLILGAFWGTAVVGMYSAAYNLIFTLATISNSVNLALFPHMSQQYATDPLAARHNFGHYTRFMLIISLPMAAIGAVLADQLAALFFTSAYTQSGLALRILVWVLPLMFVNELFGYIAVAVGLENRVAKLRLVNAFSNLALNLATIPFAGLVAASITTILTEFIGLVQFIVLFSNKAILPNNLPWLLRLGVATACSAGVAFLLRGLPVLLAGSIALAAYSVCLIITQAIKLAELKTMFSSFRRKTESTVATA